MNNSDLAKRAWHREFLMHCLNFLVSFFAVRGIQDTQCGFKLFTRETARKIFPGLHIERWAFDIELLFLCQMFKIPIAEVPVKWCEIPGSKVEIVSATLMFARDLILIRSCYLFGIWKTFYHH